VNGQISRKYKLSEESKQKSQVMRTLNLPLFSKDKRENEAKKLARLPRVDSPLERARNNPKYNR